MENSNNPSYGFWQIFNLSDDTDVKGTISSIKKSIGFRGYNVWILACSAILASIGLDTNSPAVIIGAMLISPLMSPILGIGLSVGINDRLTLAKSLLTYGIAVGATLLVSSLYFLITPFGEVNSEILSRTKPTILEVAVAFFGGVAGIVALSRREKSTAIPGVAIATALMPPLCVAGFGVAKMNLEIFLGAFYLFFLNSAFIAFSTYLIVRFLRFPLSVPMNEDLKRKTRQYISLIIILVILPSGWIMFNVLEELRFDRSIDRFITEKVNNVNHKAIDYELINAGSTLYIKLYMAGAYISEDSIDYLNSKLGEYNLEDCRLQVVQGVAPLEEDEITSRTTIEVLKALEINQSKTDTLQDEIIRMRSDTLPFFSLKREVPAAFPEVQTLAIAKAQETDFDKYTDTIPIVLVSWKARIKDKNNKVKNLENFLKARMKLDTLKLVEVAK